MNLRSLLLIVLALVMVGGTVFFAKNWLESQRARVVEAPKPEPKKVTEVLVAKADLPAGTLLSSDHIRWQTWPDETVSDGYIVRRTKDESADDDVIGAVVRQGIVAGQPITPKRIVKAGGRSFLAAVLRPGYRAVAVPIDAASGIAGLVAPGDRVDIILTHVIYDPNSASKIEHRASETVLNNVRIVALDQKLDDQSNEFKPAKTATLEVSAKQAEMLAVARELGSLTLSLRSLARDQEELDRIANSEDPLAEADRPTLGGTHTWDNQASGLVADRTQKVEEEEDSVLVSQGSSISKQIFKKGGGTELLQLTPPETPDLSQIAPKGSP